MDCGTQQSLIWYLPVMQGMDYLHFHKVVHGDLKPANLLLDSNGKKVGAPLCSMSLCLEAAYHHDPAACPCFAVCSSWLLSTVSQDTLFANKNCTDCI